MNEDEIYNFDEDSEDDDSFLSDEEFEEAAPIYRTYGMDFQRKRIRGMIDGEEAVRQAIWKILNTTRFAHLIYDDDYGNDIFSKLHDSALTDDYISSDLPVMLEDALTYDERITGVSDVQYKIVSRDSVHVTFTANTIYGDLPVEGVMATNGDDDT